MNFHWITDMTGWLDRVSGHWWFLLVIAAIAIADSVIPILPSETTVIIGGIAAGNHHYSIVWVITIAAVAAFVGDNIAYQLGHTSGPWFERRASQHPKRARRLSWASEQIRRRGGPLLISARFLPGGRTAVTIACGITHQQRKWFFCWIAAATTIWATYGALIGYAGGAAFQHNHTTAFLLGFAVAVFGTIAFEVVHRILTPPELNGSAEPDVTSSASHRHRASVIAASQPVKTSGDITSDGTELPEPQVVVPSLAHGRSHDIGGTRIEVAP